MDKEMSDLNETFAGLWQAVVDHEGDEEQIAEEAIASLASEIPNITPALAHTIFWMVVSCRRDTKQEVRCEVIRRLFPGILFEDLDS